MTPTTALDAIRNGASTYRQIAAVCGCSESWAFRLVMDLEKSGEVMRQEIAPKRIRKRKTAQRRHTLIPFPTAPTSSQDCA